MNRAKHFTRWLAGAWLIATASSIAPQPARAADAPVIDSIVDRGSGAVLWSSAQPDAHPQIKPGQAILLKGRNFGPGPVSAARPGLDPPAGGAAPGDGTHSVRASPPEAQGKELSKVLFGNVRAFERNISSYTARIDLGTGAASILARLEGKVLDYFVEPYVPIPDTWAGDIYSWSDNQIDLTVPITAYEGPIQIIRIPVTGDYVRDIKTGQPLLYVDPNTARVLIGKNHAFVDLWRIARSGEAVLASNTVPVTIALDGGDRLQYGSIAGTNAEAQAARQALTAAAKQPLVKTMPTQRSAADQYAYGEKAYWAWDWNLAVVHFALGVDWGNIFGFDFAHPPSYLESLFAKAEYAKSGIPQPAIETTGYSVTELAADGTTVKDTRLHKAMIDRTTGEGIRPLTAFGAIPLQPESGAAKLIAPAAAFDNQTFAEPTPYPIDPAFRLPPPLPKPLTGGQTRPTGWAGYVFAQVAGLLPGNRNTTEWIGFNCAACHAARVTYEYEPGGKKVSRFFTGIPNPDWKASFLALSGRTHDLVGGEGLPLNFIRQDYPAGTRQRILSQSGLAGRLLSHVENFMAQHGIALSKQTVDKTLLLYNLPPGSTEATLFNAASDPGDYANDYFFSPEAIPIITNHTPVRRALSRSELIDGFEGAYLHGEEPEGARGPMSSRSLQDLTLYTSTLHQDDELLRRIGVYRWLAYKGHSDWLGDSVNEGAFVSFGENPDTLLQPASFPPKPAPSGGLGAMRDAAVAAPGAQPASDAFSQRFSGLAGHIAHGAKLFQDSCIRCHSSGNAGMWTNEDMHPISAAGGNEPTGRYFSPTLWQRRTESIRTSLLENLYWVQQRGLLTDGHVVSDAPDNMDGLDLLVRPERCQAPAAADGNIDLSKASDLYKKLYTIRQGADHSFRIPSAGMRFELYTRFGPDKTGIRQQIVAPNAERIVRDEEGRLVARHAYFTKMDDGYYYWDYQKMRRDYGILEYGLDPNNPQDRARIGGLPAAPHPWCMPDGSSQADIDDLVVFLLTL